MKPQIYIITLTAALLSVACDPIEDTSLRDEFAKSGTPVSVQELTAALSVTQPIANADDKVPGDQYVVLDNARKDIPGTWFVNTPTGIKQYHTDHDTVIYEGNGTFDIYFVGLSAKQAVKSNVFTVDVTNCFDPYMTYLSGAKDKADKTAKKTWKLWDDPMAVYNGMYGIWKYYDVLPGTQNWGGAIGLTASDFGSYMTFEIAGNKLTRYDKDNAVVSTGGWGFSHQDRGEQILGELIVDKAMIGTNYAWQAFSGTGTPYYILRIDDDNLILCLPGTYNRTGEDWDYDASYYFFKKVEE